MRQQDWVGLRQDHAPLAWRHTWRDPRTSGWTNPWGQVTFPCPSFPLTPPVGPPDTPPRPRHAARPDPGPPEIEPRQVRVLCTRGAPFAWRTPGTHASYRTTRR